MTNCRNCGAPIHLAVNACPYCDTPYKIHDVTVDRFDIDFNYKFTYREILKMINGNGITINEARRMVGLEEVRI